MKESASAKYGRSLIFFAALFFGAACLAQNPSSQKPAAPQKERGLTAAQRKIDSLIRSVIGQMAAAGVNSSNAPSLNVSRQFSRTLIKIDDRARVHVYVEVGEITLERLDALRTTGSMEIELTNEKLKLIQGWIPFDKVETIAALDYVIRVRRPQYGKPG